MKKYRVIFTTVFSHFSSYRVEVLYHYLQSFFAPLFMMIALSYSNHSTVTVASLIPYYLLVSFSLPLSKSIVDEEIAELTASGDINNFLIKPLGIYPFLLTKEISKKIISVLTTLPFLLAVTIASHYAVPNFLLVFLSLLVSFSITFNISYLAGLFCFWIDEFWVTKNIKEVTLMFFGGAVVPYTLFPDVLVTYLRYSPFYYSLNLLARSFQNTVIFADILFGLVWIIILGVLIKVVQKKAINKYSFVS